MIGEPSAPFEVDTSLVRALLREQHPDLAGRSIVTAGQGWDNSLYRLGEDLVVRLPRHAGAAHLIAQEHRWLPELAVRLPLPIPVPQRVGRPGCGFPWAWTVASWLPGDTAATTRYVDADVVAVQIAAFVSALHQPAPPEAPRNPYRGVPLSARGDSVHACIRQLNDADERAALLAEWNRVLRVPAWSGTPLWIHGDLHPGNLLVRDGRLSAVIDFGDLTAGDPATDLAVAWLLLPRSGRSTLQAAVGRANPAVDTATWRRARGWALALGVVFVANTRGDQIIAAVGRGAIDAVLADDD